MFLQLLYNILLTLFLPPVFLYLKLHRLYSPLVERFSPRIPKFARSPVWIHAASLGEVNTAKPIIRALQERWPGIPILLTTSTLTGMEQANTIADSVGVAWFPFDHPLSVKKFIAQANPHCLILIETELWPNVLRYAKTSNVPIAIVNGRISAKHFIRYKRARRLFSPALKTISIACMQTPLDVERVVLLGLAVGNTSVTGNTKFDGAVISIDKKVKNTLRKELKMEQGARIIVFGSTRPGDELIARKCWDSLKEKYPDLFLVIAPRHLTRIDDAIEPFEDQAVVRRSKLLTGDQSLEEERIVYVDTMGELALFYSVSRIAVVGGSFSSSVQGHNPIEPAALGIPTVFGPHMKNFLVPANILTAAGGAKQANDSDELLQLLQDLLESPRRLQIMGECAQVAVLENRGAIGKTLEHIAPHIVEK